MNIYDEVTWLDEKDDTRCVAVVCATVVIGLAALVVGVVCAIVKVVF